MTTPRAPGPDTQPVEAIQVVEGVERPPERLAVEQLSPEGLPADRTTRKGVWWMTGVAVVVIVAGSVLIGMRSGSSLAGLGAGLVLSLLAVFLANPLVWAAPGRASEREHAAHPNPPAAHRDPDARAHDEGGASRGPDTREHSHSGNSAN